MKNILFLLLLAFISVSCQKISIDYIGQTFPPTHYAKIYFGRKAVKQPYDVVGKAIIRASTSFTTIEIQNKLRKTIEKKGANAAIVISYKEVPAGMYAYNNYSMCSMYDGMYGWGGMYGMYPNNMSPYWGGMGWGMGEESVQCYYDYLIRVLFIRYKTFDNESQNLTKNIYLNGKAINKL